MWTVEAALILLKHENRLCLDVVNDILVDRNDLTCLQRRCIDVLYDRKTSRWRVTATLHPPKLLLEELRKLVADSSGVSSLNVQYSKELNFNTVIIILSYFPIFVL